jgi:hypothetical protein
VFDDDLSNADYISIHPMVNTATITVKLNDLLSLLQNNHQREIEFISIPVKPE